MEIPKHIKTIVMDFDGVHTDDRVIVSEDGTESVVCSRSDGFGLEKLRKEGYKLFVISKERNVVVTKRCAKLQIECIHGIEDKPTVLSKWLDENNLGWSDILYIGNDVNDLECIEKSAVGCAPSDAQPKILKVADIVLTKPGGRGALRELAERVLGSEIL